MGVRRQRCGVDGERIDWLRTWLAKRDQVLQREHVRYRPVRPGIDVLHVFVLDVSGSMLTGGALAHAKGVLLALFEQASRRRHRVALICFGGAGAQRRFGPARPRWWNERWIAPIGGGGGTPLSAGLAEASRVLEQDARRSPGGESWLWLMTDGRSSDTVTRCPATRRVVVDFEQGLLRLARARHLADTWAADYVRWETLVEG